MDYDTMLNLVYMQAVCRYLYEEQHQGGQDNHPILEYWSQDWNFSDESSNSPLQTNGYNPGDTFYSQDMLHLQQTHRRII